MYFKHQTAHIFYNPFFFSSTLPSFHSSDSPSLSIYTPLNKSDQQGTANAVKTQEEITDETIWEMGLQVEQQSGQQNRGSFQSYVNSLGNKLYA